MEEFIIKETWDSNGLPVFRKIEKKDKKYTYLVTFTSLAYMGDGHGKRNTYWTKKFYGDSIEEVLEGLEFEGISYIYREEN